ncbi:MAG: glycosyltransferase, TIGR04372 family protein [Anaerolinea sp.]|nr:glycosyltransferase, TIGR04372 family protein [Anaerolinea sp.]
MSTINFIKLQLLQIQRGGWAELFRKMKCALQILLKLRLYIPLLPFVPAVLLLRLIRPWLLVRWGRLASGRIGHFAGNTEMYLCERDAGINVPRQRHVDCFYMDRTRSVCNMQLAIMWKRVLDVWPSWILTPIAEVNRLIADGAKHEIGNNTQHDRDVYNLLDRFPPHLKFTPEEESRGVAGLRAMGIPPDAHFVFLSVRDSAYLEMLSPGRFSYYEFRDCDIRNFVLAAEELANRGYFVIRMGAKVREAMRIVHPKIIDYATDGMRNDFMDIYLGAKCDFCISTGTGLDEVPKMFRRPVVYVNLVPLGWLPTFRREFLLLTKKHFSVEKQRSLTLSEIFKCGVGFSAYTQDYEAKGIKLIENTPEEIRDAATEMVERLAGTWQKHEDDEVLQRRFWEIFPTDAINPYHGGPLHGEIRARFGAQFLRNNLDWLK